MKMKSCIKISILLILVLASTLVSGCNGTSPSETNANNYQQRITELEKQVAELTKQTPWQLNNSQSKPIVIEGDSDSIIANKQKGQLQFNLHAGDRVEGEVSLNSYSTFTTMVGEVTDPYGNQVVQTRHMNDAKQVQLVAFPWRFAFIAPTDGEYELTISNPTPSNYQPTAHMKVTCYPYK